MLEISFQRNEPKKLVYRDYTSFSKDSLLTDLSNSIENSQLFLKKSFSFILGNGTF